MIQSPRQLWTSVLLILCLCSAQELMAQDVQLQHSSLGSAGSSSTIDLGTRSFLIQESIGQGSITGTSYGQGLILRQGFIQPKSGLASAVEEEPLAILVYPNPTSDRILIRLEEEDMLDLNISLIDLSGRVILNMRQQVRSEVSIPLAQFASGIYVLRITAAERLFTTNIQKL